MPVAQVEVQEKPAILGIGVVTEVSEVKETNPKVKGGPSLNYIQIKFEGQYTTPDVRRLVMFDPGMFSGRNPVDDLSEELQNQFIKNFASGEEWAALSPTDHFLVNRANQFLSNVAIHSGRKTSFFQGLFGDDYSDVLKQIDALGSDPTAEAIGAIITNAATGRQVVEYLVQSKEKNDDGTKSLTDFYEQRDVTPLTEDSLKAAIKRSQKAKKPTLLGWQA